MTTLVAIDFGTEKCTMAAFEGGAAVVIPAAGSSRTLPSVVAFSGDGLLLGRAALAQAFRNPARTIFGVKRLLGRKYHSPETEWLAGNVAYPLVAAHNGDAHIRVDGHDLSPEEIASFLLEHLRWAAEEHVGDKIEAVLTVPSCSDELSRRALLSAARLARLRVRALVSSTTAAALMCATNGERPSRSAILDIGAGSFGVSLVNSAEGCIRVLATAGDALLGGDDVDRRLVSSWMSAHLARTGVDLSADPHALQQLTTAAREAKRALTASDTVAPVERAIATADGTIVHVHQPALDRREFARLIDDDLGGLLEPCRWAFEDADLGTDDIDELFVVGGLARMPVVREAVAHLFHMEPRVYDDADHIVALGAARYGAALVAGSELVATDVVGSSIGIKLAGGRYAPLLRRNQPIPARTTRVFQTAREDQESVNFEVFEGECESAADNLFLGRFVASGLRGKGKFAIAFRLDRNALLHVAIVDPQMGGDRELPLQRAAGLAAEELTSLSLQRDTRLAAQQGTGDGPDAPLPARTATTITKIKGPRTRVPQTAPFIRFGGDGATQPLDVVEGAEPASSPIEMGTDSLIGTTLEGRFHIDAVIGEGGMGRVYRASHSVLDRRFAIKVLHPELASSAELAARFIEEAQAASSIKSQHVVDISDLGQLEDGSGYFIMEYIEAPTLRDLLDARQRLDQASLITIGWQISEGLGDAHALGVVHRDLKPANIMVAGRKFGTYHCTILDFGIAKMPTSDSRGGMTHAGAMMGTPQYMAPEQITGVRVDGRADIYALGLVLHEAVAGHGPFAGLSTADLLVAQMCEPVPLLRESGREIDCSAALEAVIMRCLQKDPAARFQTAYELGEALDACR